MLLRFLPLAFILILIGLCYFFIVDQYLTFEMLKTEHKRIIAFVHEHPVLTPILYISIYTISMTLAIPDGFFLSIVGGFLFPEHVGIVYVLISEMAGTLIFFLIARHTLQEYWQRKAGPLLKKLEKGFKENQVSYLLFLRFVHLIPFWLLNLAAAYFKVPLRTFAWTTFVGFIPLAFIYTQAGAGLGKILTTHESFSMSSVLDAKVITALICLGLLALAPVFIKSLRKI